jgi:galactonate dehydratase
MHWAFEAAEATQAIAGMAEHGLWFAEAPVKPEDVDGLAAVAAAAQVPIACGEEWRTIHEARPRIDKSRIAIVQPEMARTGITQFLRICRYAEAHHRLVIPHATIGIGIFLAASLQASAGLQSVVAHEFQHSIFEPNRRFLDTDMDCREGSYLLPSGAGLGVEPSREALARLER